jgi:hypothetical protein
MAIRLNVHPTDSNPMNDPNSLSSDEAISSLLAWCPHPDNARVILGRSKRDPETTLYVIELMDGRDDRGKMRGAFMSDVLEREGLYDKALVNWLKWEAESQMREFLKSHADVARSDGDADKRRIDWLETHPFMAYRQRDPENGEMPPYFCLVDEDDGVKHGRRGICDASLRECVDKAIRSSSSSS